MQAHCEAWERFVQVRNHRLCGIRRQVLWNYLNTRELLAGSELQKQKWRQMLPQTPKQSHSVRRKKSSRQPH